MPDDVRETDLVLSLGLGRRLEQLLGSGLDELSELGHSEALGCCTRAALCIERAVVRLSSVVGGQDERLDQRCKRGRTPYVGLLVRDAHLQRPVGRVRTDVPVQAPIVHAGGARLPVGPGAEDGRSATVRQYSKRLGPRGAKTRFDTVEV